MVSGYDEPAGHNGGREIASYRVRIHGPVPVHPAAQDPHAHRRTHRDALHRYRLCRRPAGAFCSLERGRAGPGGTIKVLFQQHDQRRVCEQVGPVVQPSLQPHPDTFAEPDSFAFAHTHALADTEPDSDTVADTEPHPEPDSVGNTEPDALTVADAHTGA